MNLKLLITKIFLCVLCLTSFVYAQTLDAGRTTGALDVSPTGSATYSVPIAVPPGINGVVPQISLNYNSQGGNGIAGYGWNIGGLSFITRIPRTKFHDDIVAGVNIDWDDKYALDGQRLILKSGVYGAEGASYVTENYSNITVISHGSTTTGPIYFDIYYPDGSHAVYGYDQNTRTANNWGLQYIDNPLGIRITYNYSNANNVLTIASISYGAKGVNAPLNFIYFNYKTRQRKEQSYTGGYNFFLGVILDNIRVVGSGMDYRHYKLTYNTVGGLNYERLTQVQELSGDQTKAFAPIIFTYNSTNSNINLTSTTPVGMSGVSSLNHKVLTADINGNGKMDMLLYYGAIGKNFWLYKDIKAGGSFNPSTDLVITSYYKELHAVSALTADNKLHNGQGILAITQEVDALVKFETYLQGGPSDPPMIKTYEREWNVPTMPDYYSDCVGGTVQGGTIPTEYVTGDFNGDGLSDVIAITKGHFYTMHESKDYYPDGVSYQCIPSTGYNPTSTAYFINLDKRITSNYVINAGNLQVTLGQNEKLFVGDFNGDGISDILKVEYGGLRVYQLDNNNNLVQLWNHPNQWITPEQVYPGDYNGDGKTDVMIPVNGSHKSDFYIFLSKGNDFQVYQQNAPFEKSWVESPQPPYSTENILIQNDFNGDGKTDVANIWVSKTYLGPGFFLRTYNNIGPSSATSTPTFTAGPTYNQTGLGIEPNSIPLFLSSDQPNFSLELGLLSNNSIFSFTYEKDVRKETQITSIDHDGVTQNIDYQPLLPSATNGSGIAVYNGLANLTYPYINIWGAAGLNVVSNLRRSFNSKEVKQSFGYRKGVSHAEGFGFIGFEKTIRSSWYQTDNEPGIIYTVNVNDLQNRGATLRTFTTNDKTFDTKPISDIPGNTPDLVYSSPITGPQIITASNSITLLNGATINGAAGNVVLNITDPASGIADGGDINKYITRTDYTYKTELQPSKVFINVPLSSATKNLLDGTNTVILNKYDSYYNVINETKNFSGIGTEIIESTYANNPSNGYIGRLLNEKTTLQNNGDTYSSEVHYTYTDFTPTEIKRKGNGTPFITENLTYDNYGNVISKQLVTTDGTRTESMLYDLSNRFVTKHTDIDGMETNFSYNATTGNITTKTNSFGQDSTFTYDAWGRITQANDYLGNYETTSYTRLGKDIIVTETNNQGYEKKTVTNALGLNTLVSEKNVLGQIVSIAYEYDIYDRTKSVSEPTISSFTQWNETEYDSYGRVKKTTDFTGKTTNITYNGLIKTINDGTKTAVITTDALGNVVNNQDPGGTVNNTYFANGNLRSAEYNGSVQTILQDGWGRKTQLIDPSAGTYTYTYNQFGEPLTRSTPKGTTTYTYEASTGKLQTKRIQGSDNPTDMLYQYAYDVTTKLPTTTTLTNADGNNTTYTYTYDTHKRPATITEDNLHAVFTKTFTYDSYSRVSTEQSQAKNKSNNITVSKTILNTYQYGEVKKITDNSTGIDIWSVTAMNARGQVTTAQLGANLRETNQYDQYGFPTEIKTERIQPSVTELMKLTYSFDVQRGNLTSRTNSAFNWSEDFNGKYDNLDRLTGFTDNNGTQTQNYDGTGRITSNSNIGSYNYTGSSYKLDKVTNLTTFANTYFQANSSQLVSYNAFKSPIQISVENKEIINFQYNGAQQRSHMYYGSTQATREERPFRRHYSEDGSMEITEDIATGKTSFVFYMGGDAYDAPAIWKHEQSSGGTTAGLYYLHRDYQATILMITDISGTVKEKRQFDAWGNIVKLTDGLGTDLTSFVILDRGYTGHEHLLGVGLIHMNGRLYDPLIHRFLGPDNFVQDPANTQSYNRFAYVLNNPLKYTDPSGEIIPFVVAAAAIIGGTMNVVSNWDKIKKNPWSAIGYFGSGAAGGVVSLANPALGFAVTAGGNVVTDALTGNMPKLNNWKDVAIYAGSTAFRSLSAPSAGSLAKLSYKLLLKIGWAQTVSVNAAASVPGVVGAYEVTVNVTTTATKQVVKSAAKQLAANASKKLLKFTQDEAAQHFAKHGSQIMKALGKNSYNLKQYVDDANWIIQHGQYSSKLNGYYYYLSNSSKTGEAIMGFVGLKNGGTAISTFMVKYASYLGL